MQAKYHFGDTVYFREDPEPGVVQEVWEEPDASMPCYKIAFADMPDDWDGYWYTEDVLTNVQPH